MTSVEPMRVDSLELYHLAADSIQRSGRFTFVTRGFSMFPRIHDREKVTLGFAQFDQLRVGDIVLCLTEDGPVLHGILSREEDEAGPHIRIRGTRETDRIHIVREGAVAGRVIRIRTRPFGRLAHRLRHATIRQYWNRLRRSS